MRVAVPLTLVLGLLPAGLPAPAIAGPSQEPAVSDPGADIPVDYTVGKEDLLELSVVKYPDLGGTVTVRPDGKITLQLIGDVQAEGRTITDIDAEITRRLSAFVHDPHVTLAVRQINSMKVYVLGRVTAPGMFSVGATVTFLQALALAKGFTPWAHRHGLVLVRGGNGTRLAVDFDKVVRGKQENYILYPGDTIVVP